MPEHIHSQICSGRVDGSFPHCFVFPFSGLKKEIPDQQTTKRYQPGLGGDIAELSELDLAALGTSELAEQAVGAHSFPTGITGHVGPSQNPGSTPRWTA